MDAIKELFNINFKDVLLSVFVILIGLKTGYSIFEWGIGKLGLETKWMRRRREEHELLIQTSKNLTKLQEQHTKDIRQSIIHNNKIKEELSSFMSDMKNSITETQNELKVFAENRIYDRKQSLQIQEELKDSIKSIVDRNLNKDTQINNLMVAQREALADRINQKYKYYISIKGIPEDEVDEFTNLHTAYKGVGGNHSGDAKYEYCMNHLQVIPVETKLIIKENK